MSRILPRLHLVKSRFHFLKSRFHFLKSRIHSNLFLLGIRGHFLVRLTALLENCNNVLEQNVVFVLTAPRFLSHYYWLYHHHRHHLFQVDLAEKHLVGIISVETRVG